MHERHAERLGGGIPASEEHDLARMRVSHGLDQALVPFHVVGHAELRRGNAELRRPAAIAQVAGERDLEAAAEAEAVDHREGRLARVLNGMEDFVEQPVVLRDRSLLGAVFLELGDVGAGGEGFRPAPRNATQRTSGSASSWRIAGAMPRHMAPLIAFLFAGRLKTIQPTAPRFSTIRA